MNKVQSYLIVIFSLYLSHSSGLKCYQCKGNEDIECSEKFDSANTKLHPTKCEIYNARYCIKTTGIYGGWHVFFQK